MKKKEIWKKILFMIWYLKKTIAKQNLSAVRVADI